MAVVMIAHDALEVPAATTEEALAETEAALEAIIAAHRTALLELAPHQAWRSVRLDTGWHMAQLGLLLCHRDSQTQIQTQKAARGVGRRERQEESTGPDRLAR